MYNKKYDNRNNYNSSYHGSFNFLKFLNINICLIILFFLIIGLSLSKEKKAEIMDKLSKSEFGFLFKKISVENKENNLTSKKQNYQEKEVKKENNRIVSSKTSNEKNDKLNLANKNNLEKQSQQTIEKENKEWLEAYNYIKEGKLVKLFELAKSGKDLSKMYYDGKPAICIACEFGRYEIAKYLLLQYDCNKLIDRKTGQSALHYAVKRANKRIAELFIDNHFDVNLSDFDKNTPLHYSIYNPFQECVELLLKNGANPNAENKDKQTPLHFAAIKANRIAIKLLLEKGGEINKQDAEGNTFLHYVNLYAQDKETFDIFYNDKYKLDLTIKNNEGETPRTIRGWDFFKYYEENYKDNNSEEDFNPIDFLDNLEDDYQ